ncbi:hypothetical protein ACLWBD_14890 [Bdellovibrio sp. HCB117]|uniref:hypothetical protein n=1 Tax=Bdellovibrio sp. HCB117 TaxID=3394359 RepID=UPI0039B42093
MKTFTYPTHKWVLTATLLAVLGLNVSFNTHTAGVASADFASTEGEGITPSKIYTADGVVPVKYIDNGEDKVLALVPKKMTEGKACDSCGYESYPLSVKNKEDIDSLNVALMKAIGARLTTQEKPKAEAAQEVEASGDAKINPFASLEKCDDKKSNSDVLSCRTTKYIRILKSNAKSINKEDAYDYYKENIESLILSEIAESRRIVNGQRRASVMPGQWSFFSESDSAMKDPAAMRDEALKLVRELISGVPGKFEDVRRRLISAESEMIRAEALELQQTYVQARDTKDPYLGNYLFNEGNYRRADLESLLNNVLSQTQMGLEGLKSSETSATLKNQYMTEINSYIQKIYNGMNTDVYNFMGAGIGGGTTVLPGVSLDSRLQNPGRMGTTTTIVPGVSTRTGANLTVSPGIVVQPQVTTVPGTTLPNFLPQTNNGVSFGTVSPITPQSLQQRLDIRGRF